MIPEHCIEIFKKRHTYYPNFISVNPEYVKKDLDKLFSKSLQVWVNLRINAEGKKTFVERFLEYDSSGIMVYIKEGKDIFILTTGDRMNVAEFMISSLKK